MPPPFKRPAKVLCLFDYLATTGFATVSTNLVKEMRRRFDRDLLIDIVPINYFGKEKEIIQPGDPFTRIYPVTDFERSKDAFGRWAFLKRLNEGDYTGYFILQDIGVAVALIPLLKEIVDNHMYKGQRRARGMCYFPVDSVPLDTFFPPKAESLLFYDQLVTYTEYGRRQLLAQQPELAKKLQVIPHGCKPSDFYPLAEAQRMEFRCNYFGDNADKCIIINVNRNQFRKDIPTTLLGVQEFIQRNPEYRKRVFLYLHMNPKDSMGWDLRQIAGQLGWCEGVDYGFPPEQEQDHGADVATLRGIYNATDLYLTTTTGEGWGLTVTEAMMCNCRVIAPLHTSLEEINGKNQDRFWGLHQGRPYCSRFDNVLRIQCEIDEVAAVIKQAWSNPDRNILQTMKAREFMKTITWAKVCNQWEMLFKDLFFR